MVTVSVFAFVIPQISYGRSSSLEAEFSAHSGLFSTSDTLHASEVALSFWTLQSLLCARFPKCVVEVLTVFDFSG